MKTKRHAMIIKIIASRDVETQEELARLLGEQGFQVTQATVSRDIRELKLTKVSTGHGGYRYMLPPNSDPNGGMRFTSTIMDSVLVVDYSLNIVVIKTVPSLANPVAASIDSMHAPEVLGCVAGDDTVIIVARDIDAAKEITDKVKAMIRV